MLIIGIVGGFDPETTVEYYRAFCSRLRASGESELPSLLIHCIDQAELLDLANAGELAELTELLVEAVQPLARGGARFGCLAADVSHLAFDAVQARSPIPLVSIVDATRDYAALQRYRRLGVLGTRVTLRGQYYQEAFARCGIEVLAPPAESLERLHQCLSCDLRDDTLRAAARSEMSAILSRMHQHNGIEAVILAGSEALAVFSAERTIVPCLNTLQIHVDAVVARWLGHG